MPACAEALGVESTDLDADAGEDRRSSCAASQAAASAGNSATVSRGGDFVGVPGLEAIVKSVKRLSRRWEKSLRSGGGRLLAPSPMASSALARAPAC